ncbi:MAG: hypothetical protein ABFD29_10485 [Anaerolineaceae bacterium]
MAETFIQSIRDYLQTYEPLADGVHLDFVGAEPTEYAVVMLPELQKIEEYIDHGGIYARHFMLNMQAATNEDADRLYNNGFYEAFADWLYTQTTNKVLPALPSGYRALSIEATTNTSLLEVGEALTTGIYMITCRLVYERN